MINKTWREAHKMAKSATRAQRINWHAAHTQHCACRKPPESIRAEVERLLAKKN